MDILRERGNRPPFLDFEFIEEMDDEVVKEWTGLNRVQFQDLFLSVPSLSGERRPKTALGLWLAKSGTGETDERLASLVSQSRSTFEKIMGRAREALTAEFVPRHLGIGVGITREIVRAHQTTVATELFCDIDKVALYLMAPTSISRRVPTMPFKGLATVVTSIARF